MLERPCLRFLLALVVVTILGGIIVAAAPHVPFRPRRVEFVGTMLTLLPVVVDLQRRLFLSRNVPAARDAFSEQAIANALRALLGFEWPVAVCIALGVSLIALGFAMDLARPECPPCG